MAAGDTFPLPGLPGRSISHEPPSSEIGRRNGRVKIFGSRWVAKCGIEFVVRDSGLFVVSLHVDALAGLSLKELVVGLPLTGRAVPFAIAYPGAGIRLRKVGVGPLPGEHQAALEEVCAVIPVKHKALRAPRKGVGRTTRTDWVRLKWEHLGRTGSSPIRVREDVLTRVLRVWLIALCVADNVQR